MIFGEEDVCNSILYLFCEPTFAQNVVETVQFAVKVFLQPCKQIYRATIMILLMSSTRRRRSYGVPYKSILFVLPQQRSLTKAR